MPLPTLASIIKFPTITLSVAIALLLCQASAYGQLNDSERAMVAFIDATNAAAEAELIESVNINSGTMNFAGVRAVADHMMPMFEAIGFDARWEDGAAFGRAGHLAAELRGEGSGPKILLIGHLDTVFEPSSPFQEFERLDVDRGAGPGPG